MKAAFLLAVALGASSCTPVIREHLAATVLRPAPQICADGNPIQILIGRDCTDGICGWSCLPNRWDKTEAR